MSIPLHPDSPAGPAGVLDDARDQVAGLVEQLWSARSDDDVGITTAPSTTPPGKSD